MSLTVARTGWPAAELVPPRSLCSLPPEGAPPGLGRPGTGLSSAKTSQSVAGHAAGAGVSMPRSFRIAAIFGFIAPGWVMPVRSPLTSAMKTGTPWRLKFSASVCSVTVLPVPVAPVTRPCRFAIAGRRKHSVLPRRARRMGSAMDVANERDGPV